MCVHRQGGIRRLRLAVLLATGIAAGWLALGTRQRDADETRACRQGLSFMFFALHYYLELGKHTHIPAAVKLGDGYFWLKPILGVDAGVEGMPNFFAMAPMVLQCPAMARKPPPQTGPRVAPWREGPHVHYMWNPSIAGRRMLDLPPSTTILAFDCAPMHRGGRNCCFLDGRVRWLSEVEFQRALGADAMASLTRPSAASRPAPPRPRHRTLFRTDSTYGRLEVTEAGGSRHLLVDGVPQTVLPTDPARVTQQCHLLTERYWLELLPYFRPDAGRCLLIGLGGGLLPAVLDGYGIETESVEIDPKVLSAARRYFGYQGKASVNDGRTFLKRSRQRYDLVVMDAFRGGAMPFHLVTRECFSLAKAHLMPGGVLAVNIVAKPEGSPVSASVARTLREAFAYVAAYRTEEPWVVQSVILFASDQPLEPALHPHGHRLRVGREDLEKAAAYRVYPSCSLKSVVLTDDSSPVALDWSREAGEWRRRMVSLFGRRPP